MEVERAFPVDRAAGHGFISSQRMGMDVFASIDPEASLVFATAAWQYTITCCPACAAIAGPSSPSLTGQVSGPVSSACSISMARSSRLACRFSSLWSKDFTDEYFLTRLQEWIRKANVTHDLSHVRDLDMRAFRHRRAAPAKSLPRNC